MSKKTSAEFQSVTGPVKTKRWTMIVSPVKKTVFENGVRYYITEDKKKWDANTYDAKLVPPKLKIRSKPESEAVTLTNEFVSRRHGSKPNR
jgi:hypothetical protein